MVTTRIAYTSPDGVTSSDHSYDGARMASLDPVERLTEMMRLLNESYLLIDPLYALVRREPWPPYRGATCSARMRCSPRSWPWPDLGVTCHWSWPAATLRSSGCPRWPGASGYPAGRLTWRPPCSAARFCAGSVRANLQTTKSVRLGRSPPNVYSSAGQDLRASWPQAVADRSQRAPPQRPDRISRAIEATPMRELGWTALRSTFVCGHVWQKIFCLPGIGDLDSLNLATAPTANSKYSTTMVC